MVKISSKSEVAYFNFQEAEPPIRGLTIIERSWNSGNQPYLVANTYDLNFIKIGGIWIFRGAEPPIRVAYNNRKKFKFWESALFIG